MLLLEPNGFVRTSKDFRTKKKKKIALVKLD